MELIPGLMIERLIDMLPRRGLYVGCAIVAIAAPVGLLLLLRQ